MMYFKESEQLAKRRPEIGAAVERLDNLLARVPRDAVLPLSTVLLRLPALDPHQVSESLEELVSVGVLSARTEVICRACDTANAVSSAWCTQCGGSLATCKQERVFTVLHDLVTAPSAASLDPLVAADGRPIPSVGIITALPRELAAVQHVLGLQREWNAAGSGAGLRYHFGAVGSAFGGVHTVVATLQTVTGNNSAAARATQLLTHFSNVPHVVICGIAGGIPDLKAGREGDIRLGDVVISDKQGVVQYDFGKMTDTGFVPTPSPRPPSSQLLEAALYLAAGEFRGERPWEPILASAASVPLGKRPADTAGAMPGATMSYPPDPDRIPGMPRVFQGTIASANSVLRNAEYRNRLREQHRVMAVEMEGSGVADATWLHEATGYLVIRGIADFADGQKGDVWHGAAAIAAACILRALLESMPVAK